MLYAVPPVNPVTVPDADEALYEIPVALKAPTAILVGGWLDMFVPFTVTVHVVAFTAAKDAPEIVTN